MESIVGPSLVITAELTPIPVVAFRDVVQGHPAEIFAIVLIVIRVLAVDLRDQRQVY